MLRVVMTDVTRQRQADERLRESHEQFMLAVNGSTDGIWDWDLRNNSLFLSPRWKEMIGYTDAELPNTYETFENRLHPDDKPWVVSYLGKYLEGHIPTYSLEFRLRHKTGVLEKSLKKRAAATGCITFEDMPLRAHYEQREAFRPFSKLDLDKMVRKTLKNGVPEASQDTG